MLTFPSIVKLTVTGLRISAADTVAFLDNCADLIPYAGSGRRIRIKDAAGKYLDGVLGAAGTGETYTDLVTGDNSTFASDTGFWKKGASWTITGGKANVNGILDGGTGTSLWREMVTVGTLFAWGYEITDYTSGKIAFPHPWLITNQEAIGTYAGYITCVNTTASFNRSPSGTSVLSVDNVILKQVLAPSTSGLLIRNLAGAQSFQSQESGFTHNAASYAVEVFDMMKVV